ncbi:MAG: winged helix-turn-helix domain-containing protein [Cryobacterium sp.]|nr:winged helix-turn-helix domain-containing protein [Oligoflexia bacterium]
MEPARIRHPSLLYKPCRKSGHSRSTASLINQDGEIFDRTIDSHVSHVRARLRAANVKDVQIFSVYGIGYRLERVK